ncbi:MAG: undecaprenyl diphosphate synthase family protein, partial [Nitrospinota bacterium]|nr:undecaprenyl diphosphate synthase family protein [Nitrospinota bacterium]
LLYQIAYTELFFTKVLWPDFNETHLLKALIEFQNRVRRYGLTTEQIKKTNGTQ